MNIKKVFVYTIGCQMNVYESERFVKILNPSGYIPCDNAVEADLVIVNTCSIREKAQEKAFSFLGSINEIKKNKKDLILVMAGCVAQQEGDRVLKRAPYVDIVLGTNAVARLNAHVEAIENSGSHIVDTEMNHLFHELDDRYNTKEKESSISKFVTIMQGCDNYCTYCIVPYVRGRETSRHPDNIVAELVKLAEKGIKEVTLLGQNVNSYGTKEGLCSFPELLKKVCQVDGIERIRFATSHPKDLSDDLIHAYGNLDKLCNHLHLPVQSGSNRILKRMNRRYTKEIYLERIEKLRKQCPDISIASDMIVGFPGETDEDFEETLDLMQKARFDGLFAFIYSDRPNAPAASFREKVPEKIKKARLHRLLELQETFTLQKNMLLVGQDKEILVEGKSRKQKGNLESIQYTGRTTCNKIVNFFLDTDESDIAGKLITIHIDEAHAHSLKGTFVSGC